MITFSSDIIFFIIILFVTFYTIFFYVVIGVFIKKNQKELVNILFNDDNSNIGLSFEDRFIIATTLGRLYFIYLIEVGIFKRKEIYLFKNKNYYIYPNLNNNSFFCIVEKYRFVLNFILFYFILCVLFFIYIFLID